MYNYFHFIGSIRLLNNTVEYLDDQALKFVNKDYFDKITITGNIVKSKVMSGLFTNLTVCSKL